MDVAVINYWLSMLATVAFAASAVLAVSNSNIDLFGAFVLGIVTAIGGGTIRDLILEVPVFWSTEQSYLWVSLFASIIMYIGCGVIKKRNIHLLILYLDGFGAALFGIVSTKLVWDLKFCLPVGPIMLGVIAAIGGGLMRDVLAGRKTLLMSRELYAIPVMFSCILYLISLTYFPKHQLATAVSCIFISFIFRAAAIHWKISIPYWFSHEQSKQNNDNY